MTEETYRSAQRVAEQLEESGLTEPVKRASTERIAADFAHFLVLTKKLINQTQRRVIDEERVPAEEKVVSVFEAHTDIIRKDRRETLYGHKVCLTGGSSSMILDCVILDGNPADSTLAETMIDRRVELYERAPRQVAYDGAFSSKANLEAIKGKGVEDVAFTKGRVLFDNHCEILVVQLIAPTGVLPVLSDQRLAQRLAQRRLLTQVVSRLALQHTHWVDSLGSSDVVPPLDGRKRNCISSPLVGCRHRFSDSRLISL